MFSVEEKEESAVEPSMDDIAAEQQAEIVAGQHILARCGEHRAFPGVVPVGMAPSRWVRGWRLSPPCVARTVTDLSLTPSGNILAKSAGNGPEVMQAFPERKPRYRTADPVVLSVQRVFDGVGRRHGAIFATYGWCDQ